MSVACSDARLVCEWFEFSCSPLLNFSTHTTLGYDGNNNNLCLPHATFRYRYLLAHTHTHIHSMRDTHTQTWQLQLSMHRHRQQQQHRRTFCSYFRLAVCVFFIHIGSQLETHTHTQLALIETDILWAYAENVRWKYATLRKIHWKNLKKNNKSRSGILEGRWRGRGNWFEWLNLDLSHWMGKIWMGIWNLFVIMMCCVCGGGRAAGGRRGSSGAVEFFFVCS